jgi:hypothetical protein
MKPSHCAAANIVEQDDCCDCDENYNAYYFTHASYTFLSMISS